jgi:hypothetical protein
MKAAQARESLRRLRLVSALLFGRSDAPTRWKLKAEG